MREGINRFRRSGRIRRSGQSRSGRRFTDLHPGKVKDGRTGRILFIWASFEGITIRRTDSTSETAKILESEG
jgi:hypothetical protein